MSWDGRASGGGPGTGVSAQERSARVALGCVAEPGDPALQYLLAALGPVALLEAVRAGSLPPGFRPAGRDGVASGLGGRASGRAGRPTDHAPGRGEFHRPLARWTARLGQVPAARTVESWSDDGIRVICPGDPEWPSSRLAVLGGKSPVVLWASGGADLRLACHRSVSVVGSRAATAYGSHVCTELAAALAEREWTVISGGAYGIDSCAHRGALAADGVTVAVLAGGLSYGYPRGHHQLFAAIATQGALVSEWPPDRAPTRPGFLVRNRVIAALSRGTVVVEAALRSGALNTARHAAEQCRSLMAVPGPVTSSASAGCHELIRELGAVCVTGVADVLEAVSPAGEELVQPRWGPATARDSLDPEATAVMEAVPAFGGSGPAAIAVQAGVGLDTAIRCLGSLAAAGFVERCPKGWRMRKDG